MNGKIILRIFGIVVLLAVCYFYSWESIDVILNRLITLNSFSLFLLCYVFWAILVTNAKPKEIKMNYVLLISGIFLFWLGFLFASEANRPTTTNIYYSGPNILGISGFLLFIFGILICIISGILIEKEKKKLTEV